MIYNRIYMLEYIILYEILHKFVFKEKINNIYKLCYNFDNYKK